MIIVLLINIFFPHLNFILLPVFKNFVCMNIFPACRSVHNVCIWCPQKTEEGIGSSVTGYKLPRGYQESNLGPLE